MHTLGAQIDNTMHPAIFSCAHFNTEVFMIWNIHAPAECTVFKIHTLGSNNVHTGVFEIKGAGCTLNFKHLTTYRTYAWYDTWYIYLPLNKESTASPNT